MELPSNDLINLFSYLLPGFITVAIWQSLTTRPHPQPLERIVQALIFTVIIQVLVFVVEALSLGIGSSWFVVGTWTDDTRLIWSVVLALLLGLTLARVSNFDTMHKPLRRLRITHQTSYPSVWYGAFAQMTGYVVLHLSGERRLYGWAEEWPGTPSEGHFIITRAEWLTDDGSIHLKGVEKILVDATEVVMVEFMSVVTPDKEAETNGRSKSAGSGTAAGATS